jgi:hypothetical protein
MDLRRRQRTPSTAGSTKDKYRAVVAEMVR